MPDAVYTSAATYCNEVLPRGSKGWVPLQGEVDPSKDAAETLPHALMKLWLQCQFAEDPSDFAHIEGHHGRERGIVPIKIGHTSEGKPASRDDERERKFTPACSSMYMKDMAHEAGCCYSRIGLVLHSCRFIQHNSWVNSF